MIQHRPFLQPTQEALLLASELKEYRKINHSLRRKIKEKDNKIQQLFGYIQDSGIPYSLSDSQHAHQQEPARKIARTEAKRKEKEERNSDHIEESNIFKQPSHSLIQRLSRPDVHLPSLEKRKKEERRTIFQEEPSFDHNKTKIVKISLEKLKPLNPEEVKKRFLLKYPRVEPE